VAISLSDRQPVKLRDLRSQNAGPRQLLGEFRRSVQPKEKFDNLLQDQKAGEVVGAFPENYDKAPKRAGRSKNVLLEAQKKQDKRSPEAELMAKEGVSGLTKFSRRFEMQSSTKDKSISLEQSASTPAWMQLLNTGSVPKKADTKKEDDMYKMLQKAMSSHDSRVLKEAGKIDKTLMDKLKKASVHTKDLKQVMKQEMNQSQRQNMLYLGLQENLSHQMRFYSLLSNLMKARDEASKSAISSA